MTKDVEGKDKHDEADWAPDTTGALRPALCAECGTHIYLGPNADAGLCLACARDQAGITWASGTPITQWHPTVGYERPTFVGTDHTTQRINHIRTTLAAATKTDWHWGCIDCHETGTALNADHAQAMHKMHQGYACPMTPGITQAELILRIARRAAHSRLNPETTPWVTARKDTNGHYQPVMGKP